MKFIILAVGVNEVSQVWEWNDLIYIKTVTQAYN